jgi:N-acetylglucosamine-6-phosphate deacetylase
VNQTAGYGCQSIDTMKQRSLIRNCRLASDPGAMPTDILIEGSKIAAIGIRDSSGVASFDAGGRVIAPGFIDIHIQGAGGADVLDGTREALQVISRTLARLGTTSFLGTTVAEPGSGHKHLRMMREHTNKDLDGATLLGIHLEGPFINPAKRGGIAPGGIYPSSPGGLDELFDAAGDTLRMMTIAPELPGNLDMIRRLVDRGTVAAFAHSAATYDELRAGFAAGISHITHIFNAMTPLHHRDPGPLAAIFENSSVTAQIISDGHHVHPAVVRLLLRVLGKDRCVGITDGVQGMGLPDGRYRYNGREYDSIDGVARYGDGTLIGTTMGLGVILRRFMEFTGCSLRDAIDTVTIVPARVLGIDSSRGSIAPGKHADLVILNHDLSVHTTIVSGRIIHTEA